MRKCESNGENKHLTSKINVSRGENSEEKLRPTADSFSFFTLGNNMISSCLSSILPPECSKKCRRTDEFSDLLIKKPDIPPVKIGL